MFKFIWDERLYGENGGGFDTTAKYFYEMNKYIEEKQKEFDTRDNEIIFSLIKKNSKQIDDDKYLFTIKKDKNLQALDNMIRSCRRGRRTRLKEETLLFLKEQREKYLQKNKLD